MTRFAPLHRKFALAGWEIQPAAKPPACWWAWEIWQMQSLRTPVGATVFVSFLLDPMCVTAGKAAHEGAVWAIGVTKTRPDDRTTAEDGAIAIKHRMKSAIAGALAAAESLRGQG